LVRDSLPSIGCTFILVLDSFADLLDISRTNRISIRYIEPRNSPETNNSTTITLIHFGYFQGNLKPDCAAMFPRRRPLLGAALVVGASRSAAKNEVNKQAQRDEAAQQAADRQRHEEQERQRQMQLAIDEAIAKEKHEEHERQRQMQLAIEEARAKERAEGGKVQNGEDEIRRARQITGSGHDGNRSADRFCPECGHGCRGSDKFCASCGTKLKANEA
jgi:rubrerythrin